VKHITRFDFSSLNTIMIYLLEMGWILSRDPELSEENTLKVKEILAENGLHPSQFKPVIQDCGLVP